MNKYINFPVGKTYDLIYIDPPWKYVGMGASYQPHGHAQAHYPCLSDAELMELPVRSLAAKDCALYMWATSPMLARCFPIVDAWGFTYKSSWVWDKISHNMGFYNSVRHELLLVFGRGKSVPTLAKGLPRLFDSVVSIERAEHSRKPDYFREKLEYLYPTARKIELFARQRYDGWDAWGNQV